MQILCVASLWICGAAPARALEPAERVPLASREIVFSPPGGRFSVRVPAEPVVSAKTRQTLFGAVVETRYAVEIADTSLAVELYELPRIAAFLLPASAILGRARARLLEGTGGRAVATRDAPHRGFPAREVAYEIPEQPIRVEKALLVLVEHRLYIALATWPRALAAHPAAERLFETFEVWQP